MKKLFLILVSVFFAYSAAAQENDSLLFTSLKPAEFNEKMMESGDHLVIDVREFFEFKKMRLKGAVNFPSSGNIIAEADTIGRSVPIFVYCTSGFRSRRNAGKLTEMGFVEVYNLDGGINEWRKEKYPVDHRRIRRDYKK